MLRQVFESVSGYWGFGILSMLIFLVFFVFLLIHTFSIRKKEVEEFSRIPFEDSDEETVKNVKN
jgi:hypothetical protein